MVGTSNKGNASTASIDQVLGGLLSSLVTISHHTREFIGKTSSSKEHQGDTHARDLLEMTIVSGILRQTGDDALHVQTDEVVDGPYLSFTIFVGVRTDHGITILTRLLLDTIEHSRIVVRHQIGNHHTNNSRSLLTQTLCKRVRSVVKTFSQFFDFCLHLQSDLG